MSTLDEYLRGEAAFSQAQQRPWVTLTYAQSLDGSLTAIAGQGTPISGPETKKLTHELRAAHQAILVGVGTLLADDPHLGVRHAEGPDPRPILLDSHLRTPPGARVLQRQSNLPWIFCHPEASPQRRTALEKAGARVLPVQPTASGRLDLAQILYRLYELEITSLMVEGGAQVLQSFLAAGLFELLVLTIAPRWIGGLPAVDGATLSSPPLRQIRWKQRGSDAVLWALHERPEAG